MPPKGVRASKVRVTDDGRWQKVCTGPLHRQGAWVDFGDYGQIKTGRLAGRPRAQCKDCDNFHHFGHRNRMVKAERVWFAVEELVRRLGVTETHRRLGRSQQWLWQFRKGRMNHVQKRTAAAILTTLWSVRQAGEVRHRDSIFHGSAMRGHEEKEARYKNDFYKTHLDIEAQAKRAQRERRAREQSMVPGPGRDQTDGGAVS